MLVKYVTKKLTLTEKDRQMIEKKLTKLGKFFEDDTVATVNISELKNDRRRVELTILFKETFYRSEIEDADCVSAIEKAIDVIEGQIRKNKTRLKKRLRDGAFDKYSPDLVESVPVVARTKKFQAGIMDVQEAIMEMELLSHQFYVFRNIATDKLNIVYLRKDGEYGLLVPEE